MENELVVIFFGGVFTSVTLYEEACGDAEIVALSILLTDFVVKLMVIMEGERDRLICE